DLGEGGVARQDLSAPAGPMPTWGAHFEFVCDEFDVVDRFDLDATGGVGEGGGGARIPGVVADLGVAVGIGMAPGRAPDQNVVPGHVGLTGAAGHGHPFVGGNILRIAARIAAETDVDAPAVVP